MRVECLDRLEAPGLPFPAIGLGPADRRPVGRKHQPCTRIGKLYAVAGRFPDIEEEGSLDRVLVRPGFDMHAVLQEEVGGTQDVLALVRRVGQMMEAARSALDSSSGRRPYLIAVTALTSLATKDLEEIGFNTSAEKLVERLALLTKNCGLDGVVCSSQEVRRLRNLMGDDFLLVTPGIRPANTEVGDQKRVMTPSEAIREGSDYLVVGRPITQSPEPLQALEAIMQEVSIDST